MGRLADRFPGDAGCKCSSHSFNFLSQGADDINNNTIFCLKGTSRLKICFDRQVEAFKIKLQIKGFVL